MLCPLCAAAIPAGETTCPGCGAELTDYLNAKYQPDLLFNEALQCMRRESFSDAGSLLCRAHALRPDDIGILDLWIRAEYASGNKKRALELMMDLVELDSSEGRTEQLNLLVEEYDRDQADAGAVVKRELMEQNDRLQALLNRLERRLDQMENLEEETARELVFQAAGGNRTEGILQDYLFRVQTLRSGKKRVVLLNCETRLTAVRKLILISVIACAGGILLAWLLVTLASRKAVEPTMRNMEQQKQFITNASHELKTPLTVISTNMELMEMEDADNPWIKSTQKQTAVLRRLVDELVYLSRMEEENSRLTVEQIDAGKLLEETAEPFISMAEFSGREMTVEAEEGLQINGDRASLQRLMSTLCDNAVKYASAGPIRAEIHAEGKNHVALRVSNPVAEPLTRKQCEQLFNRFYRVDESRSKEKKAGFGIGLAIAAAIAEKHGGRISAAMEDENIVFTCVLPKEAKF